MAASEHELPVLVGLGELVRRPGADGSRDPGEMMAAAVRLAADDSGAGESLLTGVGAIGGVSSASWLDGDPGRRVAEILGLQARTVRASMFGGNSPQLLANKLCERIGAGGLDAAIICGAEALHTVAAMRKRGEAPDWPQPDPARPPDEVLESERAAGTDAEAAVGMIAPIMAYPLIENAIGAAAGRSPAEHLGAVGDLWSRFSEVSARRPAAWTQRAYSAAELITPSAANRQVTLPYTKLLNSNIQVDQAAAVILCSASLAERLGIPRERWVYAHAGANASDEWNLSERRALDRSPAIRACGEALFGHAEIVPGELGPIDLYSCFPAAVELAAGELGLSLDDTDRPLTETGGLTFFGGPGNNYATHGIVAVARALREAAPGTVGMSTALGWYATKHALGLYGNEAPGRAFAAYEPELEPTEPRAVAEPLDAEAQAETATVIYDRDGAPSYSIAFGLLDDGRRVLCKSDDPEAAALVEAEEFIGSRITVRADRTFG